MRGFARLSFAPVAGLGAAVLACACGGASSSSPAPSASATGPVVFDGPGFSVSIPRGWTDHTHDQAAVSSVNANGTMQMLLYAPRTSSVIGNEHINVTTVQPTVPDDQLSTYLQNVQGTTSNVSQPEPFNLNGATGIFITFNLSATGTSAPVMLKEQDMLVNHAGETYEIVLNTAESDFNAQQQSLQQVLNSWKWS